MRDDPDFISWTFDPLVNRDRTDIILDMVRFIREGLRDQGGPPKPHQSFAVFENLVKAALFERLQSPMARPIPKRMLNDPGNTTDLVAAVFTREHSWASHRTPVAAFPAASISSDLELRLNAFPHPPLDEETAGLKAAFDVAYSNAARASTRITLMHVIPALLKMSGVDDEFYKLREDLWMRKVGFHRDLLTFGGLLGGVHLQTAVALVAKQSCLNEEGARLRFGLIHYLQRDGYSPGRWMSITEENLEKDIIAAFERLSGD